MEINNNIKISTSNLGHIPNNKNELKTNNFHCNVGIDLSEVAKDSHYIHLCGREKILTRASFSKLLHHAPQVQLGQLLTQSQQSQVPLKTFIDLIKEWEWALSYFKKGGIDAISDYLNYKKTKLGSIERQLAFLNKIIDKEFRSTLDKNKGNSELFGDIYSSEYQLHANWNSNEQEDQIFGKIDYCRCALAFFKIDGMPRVVNETAMIEHLINVSENLNAPRHFAVLGSGKLGDVREMISRLVLSGCTNLIIDLVEPEYATKSGGQVLSACKDFQFILSKEGFKVYNNFIDLDKSKVHPLIQKGQERLYRSDYGGTHSALNIQLNWFACDSVTYYEHIQKIQQDGKSFVPCHAVYACDLSSHKFNMWELFLYEARKFCNSQGPLSAAFLCDKVEIAYSDRTSILLNGEKFMSRYLSAMKDQAEYRINKDTTPIIISPFREHISPPSCKNTFIETVKYRSGQVCGDRTTYINTNPNSFEEFDEKWMRFDGLSINDIARYLKERKDTLWPCLVNSPDLAFNHLLEAIQENDYLKPLNERNYGGDSLWAERKKSLKKN